MHFRHQKSSRYCWGIKVGEENATDKKSWIRRFRREFLIGGPVVTICGIAALYCLGGRYVTTDDAYVQGARGDISANVAGRVAEIDVHENEAVRKGRILIRLDPGPFDLAVHDAEAQLAIARAHVQGLKAVYRERLETVKAQEFTSRFRQQSFERQSRLAVDRIVSKAQLENSAHDLALARQAAISSRHGVEEALAELNFDPEGPIDRNPIVIQSAVNLARAKLELSYATIRAPFDGVVTKVDAVQIGDQISSRAPIFALVSKSRLWIEANFKETELKYIKKGQSAELEIDALPDVKITGYVESFSPGTGSSFSILPPENSSGNWVKVVQRLPVRLLIDKGMITERLASGMSVTVSIDTGARRISRVFQ
jgi:membrane fusion protein (multidrug efflux system)